MICSICETKHSGIITSDGICDDCRFGRKPKEVPKPKAKRKTKPKVKTVSKVEE